MPLAPTLVACPCQKHGNADACLFGGFRHLNLHAVGDGLAASVGVNDFPKGRVGLRFVVWFGVHVFFLSLFVVCAAVKSGGAGVVDEVEAARAGELAGDLFGDLVTAEVLQVADRLGVFVTDVNHP